MARSSRANIDSLPCGPQCALYRCSGATIATLDQALAAGTEALNAHIAWMLEDGDPVPTPRSLDALRAAPDLAEDFEAAVVATVPAFIPGRRA
jgi:hypothetical protein